MSNRIVYVISQEGLNGCSMVVGSFSTTVNDVSPSGVVDPELHQQVRPVGKVNDKSLVLTNLWPVL